MKTSDELLLTTPWFPALPQRLQDGIRNDVRLMIVEAGGYVCRRGDASRCWFGVVDGLIKVCNTSSDGRLMTFAGLPPGAWFGEGTVLKSEPWHYDAIALRPSRIACLPSASFFRLLDEDIAFTRFLLEHVNERLGQFMATLQSDRLTEPALRVANCLLAMFNARLYPLGNVEIQLTQEEIGYLCGVTRQKVNLAVRRMETLGLLNVSYGRVTVTDLAGLRRFATRTP
ncbi:Crp/Fnr family transcriptional regulator [Burkholderia sp. Bp8998]|uniref:Crp/Fnr family transcriptional regulator n=1 Tax=Burkholderia sp. Bp8998 TaxID=2184557 RepID=UPI000F5A24CF|nr:Crp/Fnr family transcriptional regulator [Burkholderia sp. Bp8998]RQS06886.1 Crp/Fnr family transcriptional regulator [Burkholderia sp. Bp8998]